MIAAVVLLSLALGILATGAMLLARHSPGGERSVPADLVAVAIPTLSAVALLPFGFGWGRSAAVGAALGVGAALWLGRTRRWTIPAHVTWTSVVTGGAAFLLYTAVWTVTSSLGVLGTVGAVLLWLFELAAYLLTLAYLWEMVDAVGSRTWLRRVPPATSVPSPGDDAPMVSIHVPTHNEPPDMVIDTLQHLLALDYPNFEVIVLDNNTSDEELWRPVEAFCAAHPARLRFHHLEPWPGYKSGALNFGLTVTDPAAEYIAVVDADYLAEPHWLASVVPMFDDPAVGFVQTPQDYRDWEGSRYYRRLYHSYDYFFAVSQRSRDERDAAIFGGTMGVVRRTALAEVGGWDEWCITEDAELSLRLMKAGYSGRHLDASYGHGIMPLTFEALKGQRFRWCFGGVQILRLHWRSLMPWNSSPDNNLTQSQRLAYLSGGVQWFGDLVAVAFLGFLLLSAINVVAGGDFVLRRLSPLLLIAIPVLVLASLLRAVAVARHVGTATWREAAGALLVWMGLGLTVARACVRGAVEKEGVFLRTPKTRAEGSIRASVRMNRVETLLGGAAWLAAVAVLVTSRTTWAIELAGLLMLIGIGHLAAPVNSIAALRASLSDELAARRRTERARAWVGIRSRRFVGAVALMTAVGGILLFLSPATADRSTPPLRSRIDQAGLLDGVAEPTETTTTTEPSSVDVDAPAGTPDGDEPNGDDAPAEGTTTTTGSTTTTTSADTTTTSTTTGSETTTTTTTTAPADTTSTTTTTPGSDNTTSTTVDPPGGQPDSTGPPDQGSRP